jgi:hypothetical protein
MAMDLLERYLQAVGQYLPAATKDDTIAELRANLLERIDAREEELGRPLQQSDVAEILKEHGKPEVVALRYLPQQSLIGPAVFPFYKLTMARVLPLVVLVSLIAQGAVYATSRHETFAHALVGFAFGVWPSLLISAAIITAIFAAIEWARERGKLGEQWNAWDPAKLPSVHLPAVGDVSPRSTFKRVLDLSLHCLWMAYVLWVPWHPFWIMGPGVFYMDTLHVALAPVWHTFYGLLIMLLVVQLVMKLLAFVSSAQKALVPMKTATDLLGLVAVGMLAASSTYFVAAGVAADTQQIATVNYSVGIAFRIVFLIVLAGFVKELWKYVKRTKPVQRMAF